MAKRITVMIDDENLKKLRNLQSKMIKESNESVSFSRVINKVLKKGRRKFKEIQYNIIPRILRNLP